MLQVRLATGQITISLFLVPARRTRCIYGNSRQVFVRFRSSCFSIMSSIRASMRRNSAIAEAFFTRSWQKESKAFLHVRRFLQSMPGMRSRSATARRTGEPSVRWARSAQALGAAARNPRSRSTRCEQPGFRRGRCIRPAGRTAMITTPGARRSATARGTISARASRSRNLTAAGLPVRPAARFWCTAAASEDPRQTIRLSRQTAR